MSSSPETADTVLAMFADALGDQVVTARRMFGEYGLYCDGRFFGLICDETLFLKPLPEVRAAMRAPDEAHPFPGAKLWLRPGAEEMDDPEQLARLVRIALAHLPTERPKKPSRRKKAPRI